MKLYEAPNKTQVRVLDDIKTPPGAPPISEGEEIFFSHIDGMYSYCKDREGNVVHLVAWAEVEVINNDSDGN